MDRPNVSAVMVKLADVAEEMDRLERHNTELENDNIRLSNENEQLNKKMKQYEEVK